MSRQGRVGPLFPSAQFGRADNAEALRAESGWLLLMYHYTNEVSAALATLKYAQCEPKRLHSICPMQTFELVSVFNF